MSIVGDISQRGERPAYVRFERVAVEDVVASKLAGRYVAKDVDFALVTAPFSRDIFKRKAIDWLADNEQNVRNDRMPREWADAYRKAYERFKAGEETPLNGTPIKGWGVISPSQQENLIHANILIVEDLAVINDEGKQRLGMGAIDLKNKAIAWLAQLNDKGPLTQKMASIEAENSVLKGQVETLMRQVNGLTGMVKQSSVIIENMSSPLSITAQDLLDEPEPMQHTLSLPIKQKKANSEI